LQISDGRSADLFTSIAAETSNALEQRTPATTP
jgi:hypothetical protein